MSQVLLVDIGGTNMRYAYSKLGSSDIYESKRMSLENLDNFNEINKDKINELFSLPQNIKGFGPVKEASINATQLRRAELLLELENESLEKLAAE